MTSVAAEKTMPRVMISRERVTRGSVQIWSHPNRAPKLVFDQSWCHATNGDLERLSRKYCKGAEPYWDEISFHRGCIPY